jgi:hypothetical protein
MHISHNPQSVAQGVKIDVQPKFPCSMPQPFLLVLLLISRLSLKLRAGIQAGITTVEEILELVRRSGRQLCRNAYYRTCYSLLKKLQERVQQILQRLVRSHMGDSVPSLNLHTVTVRADQSERPRVSI